MAQRDLLPECIPDTKVPLDAFAADYCSRCLNLECTRSVGGKSKFEKRVTTWEDRLFKNPPKMSPDDPRFERISAQKFITIDTGRTPEIRSSWVDPSDLEEPTPRAHVPEVTEPVRPPSSEAREPNPKKDSGSPRSTRVPSGLALGNAPDQSGKTLQAPPSASISRRDPWAVPAASDPADQIVSPGATVKLRGSGV